VTWKPASDPEQIVRMSLNIGRSAGFRANPHVHPESAFRLAAVLEWPLGLVNDLLYG
jgi:hypothetical protein